jgi:hypothetical protein
VAKSYITPVKNVLRIINSCQTFSQLENCKLIVSKYIKSAKNTGIVNINDLHNRLNEELLQREESIYLSDIFNC